MGHPTHRLLRTRTERPDRGTWALQGETLSACQIQVFKSWEVRGARQTNLKLMNDDAADVQKRKPFSGNPAVGLFSKFNFHCKSENHSSYSRISVLTPDTESTRMSGEPGTVTVGQHCVTAKQ
jgi:hypothetical protein